ncbi:MAG: DNA repair helicase, partial [Nitrosopumilaceae archaeon]
AEKIGIFRDSNNDTIAFTGTSNETFSNKTRNFECIDVYTSWNDKQRIDLKIQDFENLWDNNTKYVDVYDFKYADKNNLLKYTAEGMFDIS